MSDDFRVHLRRRLIECDVPVTLHDGLIEYLAARRPVGEFLTAVLKNDLRNAVVRADARSSLALRQIVLFLHNYAGADAWGSPAVVAAWLADPQPAPEIL